MLKYKGFIGVVEFDDEAKILHGEVINTRDVITFQAKNTDRIEKEFRKSVDEYIKFCKERNEEPEKPFSGKFIVRVGPEIHERLVTEAKLAGKSLNSLIEEKLKV